MNKRKNSKQAKVEPTAQPLGIMSVLDKRVRLKCRNQKQKEYANLITDKEIVVCVGPAGTGKTHIAIARAIELLQNKTNKYNKLILCKPAIEAGEKLGFLPGSIKDKMAPIMESLVDVIDKIISKEKRIKLEEMDIVKIQTLAFIRGKTIDNAILVVDESQNMTKDQVKTLLTRIGENSKFIISGDLDQSDVFRDFKRSGLYDAWTRHKNIPEMGFFEFKTGDIVRNPIISKILKNYVTIEKKEDKGGYHKNVKVTPKPKTLLTEDSKEIKDIKRKNKKTHLVKNFFNKFKW